MARSRTPAARLVAGTALLAVPNEFAQGVLGGELPAPPIVGDTQSREFGRPIRIGIAVDVSAGDPTGPTGPSSPAPQAPQAPRSAPSPATRDRQLPAPRKGGLGGIAATSRSPTGIRPRFRDQLSTARRACPQVPRRPQSPAPGPARPRRPATTTARTAETTATSADHREWDPTASPVGRSRYESEEPPPPPCSHGMRQPTPTSRTTGRSTRTRHLPATPHARRLRARPERATGTVDRDAYDKRAASYATGPGAGDYGDALSRASRGQPGAGQATYQPPLYLRACAARSRALPRAPAGAVAGPRPTAAAPASQPQQRCGHRPRPARWPRGSARRFERRPRRAHRAAEPQVPLRHLRHRRRPTGFAARGGGRRRRGAGQAPTTRCSSTATSGLGKTHLLHAIGHYAREPVTRGTRVRYVSSEEFTNEFINSIRDGKADELPQALPRHGHPARSTTSSSWRSKEPTQEEFFHTFNTLHNANKQIVHLLRPAAQAAGDPGGPAPQPVRVGPDHRRPAARARDPDRDPAQEGRAGAARSPRPRCWSSSPRKISSQHPRAGGRADPGDRLRQPQPAAGATWRLTEIVLEGPDPRRRGLGARDHGHGDHGAPPRPTSASRSRTCAAPRAAGRS